MSYTTVGAIQVKNEEEVREVVADIKNDATETNFVVLGYEDGKSNCIQLVAKGTEGIAGVLPLMTPTFMGYAYIRVISGDAESRRPKFIFISFSGESVSLVKKGKMGTHVSSINTLFGYSHIQVQASLPSELDEADLMDKVKKASGADYDSGSNKGGYTSKVTEIKAEGSKAFSS
ncbi:cofilin/ADF [Monocercomonoides exilis]|uniref:cofilin/ADF n=1 Tax=Monocercomonoides exilis TaxID=2049356 RepID=UPI00355A6F17|nr:cofilin/ADF [Monocercomonoides exilis]|eukprot:MONOS_11307.1-p1 / transcript=MONOS_11307.1 / gene=MONOS_11307 / organism=Monocercomonoides_exilis_PA203 / gene_product=cofilin/ADF / transcript_product=cofilin/ADF / location=Mono_scaffold00561:603-1127(-) / protein_length=174 / sequence_SO=supercontig / SO=protein_coding / is_pseudo=false